ncbi:MAG: trypsin-like serine protease [Betaproteobacteria bacterium]
MRKINLALTALALALAAGAASVARATPSSVSGVLNNGIQRTASQMLTGTTNTQTGGPVTNGGDPIYWPSYPRDSGVVQLLMDYGGGQAFICSGSLLSDRQSILTAAHCVSDGFGTANPLTTYVMFQPVGGVATGTRIYNGVPPAVATGVTTITVSGYTVHPLYTGQVIDQNDIAVLRLSQAAPSWASAYDLYTGGDLTGAHFNVAGYGALGDGATGRSSFTARLRSGDNRYDFRFGDVAWGAGYWDGEFDNPSLPAAQIAFSYVSDFDNGLAANDASCLLAADPDFTITPGSSQFCNTGVGAREVGVASGDSGGPNFINGRISGINSYGLSFGAAYGDSLSGLNSSFGEFSGYVPTFIHADFINAALVPEPGTYAMMLAGLAAMGLLVRRRRI